MDYLTLWLTIMLMCCVSTRLSMCEFFHPEQTENMTDRTNCTLEFVDRNQIDLIKMCIDDGNRLIRFKLNILGDIGPLGGKNPDGLLRPDNWILSTDDSGKSLLFLPEDYIQKSLWTLSFSEKNIEITLRQIPDNCFGADNTNYTLQEIKNTIRYHLLRNFSFASDEVSENFEVCNLQIITETDNTTANLKYICCSEITSVCKTLESGIWMDVFETCLYFVQFFFAPLFSPLLIPKSLYKKSVFLFKYIANNIRLQPFCLRKGMFDQPNQDLDRDFIRLSENHTLPFFRNTLRELPNGEHILNISSVSIEANSENLLEYGRSPVTLFSFIVNYFGRCNVRRDDKYLKAFCSYCPSNKCFDLLKVAAALIFLLSPWWVTIIFFCVYDKDLYDEVEHAHSGLGLETITISNSRRSMLTPYDFVYQGFFIGILLIFVFNCKISPSFQSIHFRRIFRFIMSQNNDIADRCTFCKGTLKQVENRLICGCLCFPAWAFLKLVHLLVSNIPFLKLCYKVFSFCKALVNNELEVPFGRRVAIFATLILFYAGCFLCMIISYIAPFYIEIFVLTTAGILLNYDDVFKYVILIILILVYGYQSFRTNVSTRYCAYLKSVVRYILQQNREQMLANENDSNQADNGDGGINTQVNKNGEPDGFAYMTPSVSCTQHDFTIFLLQTPDSENQQLIWKAPGLLLFHDITRNNSYSYIPAEFFNGMNLLPKNFCPGLATELYSKALREFTLGLLFISFWILAIFALGRVQELSATVQTIVAVGTGLLPFGLQTFVLKSKAANLSKIEKDHMWQIMFDKTAHNFSEPLIVSDIELTKQDEAVANLDGVNNIQFAQGSNERPFSTVSNISDIDFFVITKDNENIIYVRRDMVRDSLYEETDYVDGYQPI